MRVTRIDIESWRNFRNISMQIPPDASLVCLVGENGTGKSNVLELLSASAQRLGVSAGIEIARGNPFEDDHSFEVEVQLPEDVLQMVGSDKEPQFAELVSKWNRTITFRSRKMPGGEQSSEFIAGGLEKTGSTDSMINHIVEQLRAREETQHLYLDADRSYPPYQVQPHQYGELLSQPWESPEWTKQWAYRSTRTLYEEWIKYFLAQEGREAAELLTKIRRAREVGDPDPQWEDHFASYKESVAQVLPHLRFVGVETQSPTRTLLFDTSGVELPFSKLSGGERELAFLIGQVERFQLRRGLLLIDEPELHLNPDLLRIWLAFLRDTVEEGQVWIATHSLEAVEVAGQPATFVMERTGDTRIVERVSTLENRPVMSALSAAVGAPAFSIAQLRFVLVEGARETQERERFYRICGEPTVNRFLEGGSCDEVVRKLDTLTQLASETDEQLRVGGVVDRDFRTDEQIASIRAVAAVHVLGCHEIENLFLHPDGIGILVERSGKDPKEAQEILQNASDVFAGMWVVQKASAENRQLARPDREMRKVMGRLSWSNFKEDRDRCVAELVDVLDAEESEAVEAWKSAIVDAVDSYRSCREADDLWARCLGKQVSSRIPHDVGLSDASTMESQVVQMWERNELDPPDPAKRLLSYVQSLTDVAN